MEYGLVAQLGERRKSRPDHSNTLHPRQIAQQLEGGSVTQAHRRMVYQPAVRRGMGGGLGVPASLRKNYCREMKVTPLQIFFFWYNVAVVVL